MTGWQWVGVALLMGVGFGVMWAAFGSLLEDWLFGLVIAAIGIVGLGVLCVGVALLEGDLP